MATTKVTIQAASGKFVSANGKGPTLATVDDKKGAQTWVLEPRAPDTYAVHWASDPKSYLGAKACGTGVSLGLAQDLWVFKPVNARARIFTIQHSESQTFLTVSNKGVFEVHARLPAGGGAAHQQFTVSELPQPKVAEVFVGGAFERCLRDLAFDAKGWASVAPRVGYWLHPMGMAVAKDGNWLGTLLSNFGVRRFVYEMDAMAWSDGTNPVQTNTPSCWADWLRAIAPDFQCEFYAPWIEGERLANMLDDTCARYRQIRLKMDAAGYAGKGYFFYAPPCPSSIANADSLLKTTRDGMSHIEYVLRNAGLKGVVLDFPASLYLANSYGSAFPPDSASKCRLLAKQAHDVARKLKLPFGWVFNGAEADVRQAIAAIKGDGIALDFVGIDNFADAQRRGTPDSDPSSVSGQARSALA